MSELTPATVIGLWGYMSRRFGTTTVSKPRAAEMRLLAGVLGRLGVLDAQTFLARYATTIGRRIYVPFEVGVPERGWPLWSQLRICVHEHQHVVQLDEHGAVPFALRYLGSRSGRALLEADAYRTSLELHYWRFRELPRLDGMAHAVLSGYALRGEDVEVAQRVLELSGDAIQRGAVITRAGRAAIDWLESDAPELRLRGASA